MSRALVLVLLLALQAVAAWEQGNEGPAMAEFARVRALGPPDSSGAPS